MLTAEQRLGRKISLELALLFTAVVLAPNPRDVNTSRPPIKPCVTSATPDTASGQPCLPVQVTPGDPIKCATVTTPKGTEITCTIIPPTPSTPGTSRGRKASRSN